MERRGDDLKLILRTFVISAASTWVFASALIHPWGAVKTASSSNALFLGAQIGGGPLSVFERSCQNCHSEKTRWPWYSYLAPMSILVESDVNRARGHLNLSHWDEYSAGDQQSLLASIAAAVRSRQMPPSRYTWLHPDAKLSAQDRGLIYNWAHTERRRIRVAGSAESSAGNQPPSAYPVDDAVVSQKRRGGSDGTSIPKKQ